MAGGRPTGGAAKPLWTRHRSAPHKMWQAAQGSGKRADEAPGGPKHMGGRVMQCSSATRTRARQPRRASVGQCAARPCRVHATAGATTVRPLPDESGGGLGAPSCHCAQNGSSRRIRPARGASASPRRRFSKPRQGYACLIHGLGTRRAGPSSIFRLYTHRRQASNLGVIRLAFSVGRIALVLDGAPRGSSVLLARF